MQAAYVGRRAHEQPCPQSCSKHLVAACSPCPGLCCARGSRGGRNSRGEPPVSGRSYPSVRSHLQLWSPLQEAFHEPRLCLKWPSSLLPWCSVGTPVHSTLKGNSPFPEPQIGAKVSLSLKISFRFHFCCQGSHKNNLKNDVFSTTQRRKKLIFIAQNLKKTKSILLIMANVAVGHEPDRNHWNP